jgi:hypothetical protein
MDARGQLEVVRYRDTNRAVLQSCPRSRTGAPYECLAGVHRTGLEYSALHTVRARMPGCAWRLSHAPRLLPGEGSEQERRFAWSACSHL